MENFPWAPHKTKIPANILCIDQFSNFGGGQRSLLDLLPAFSERGWNASVAIPGDGPFSAMIRHCGYRTHSFVCGAYVSRKKPLSQMLKYAFELPNLVDSFADLVERHKINLLYVNGPRLVPPLAWLAWRKRIPLVFHCHNRPMQSAAIALTGQALELASAHVIACCQYVADPLRDYVEPHRLRVLYNGVPEMGGGPRPLNEIRKIGVVGRVEAEKGQLEFVQAAKLVSQQFPGCRFLIAGSPMFSDKSYYGKVVAASNGLPIDFVEWQEEVSKIYSELDLLVVPSSAVEATTRVIPEAFSAGVPVLAFSAGGIPEVLEDEKTGFVAAGNSVRALSERILSVLRMERTVLESITKRARTEWDRRFTLRTYRNSVCEVIEEAIRPYSPANLSC
ncbi:MAG TPA: glycosyltransferase family 4 protein [Bryobacteraceae bacterium]|nr:glycosyltransferase family 4 protein [Bryobacteraceae bacterium]